MFRSERKNAKKSLCVIRISKSMIFQMFEGIYKIQIKKQSKMLYNTAMVRKLPNKRITYSQSWKRTQYNSCCMLNEIEKLFSESGVMSTRI